MVLIPGMCQVNDCNFLLFCLVLLEYVFNWRLSAIKILLELEFSGHFQYRILTN